MHAAMLGKLEWIEALLEKCDPWVADQKRAIWGLSASFHEYGETALMHAVKNGHAACVDALAGASDPNAVRASDGRGALSIAAEESSVDILETLWSHGWRDPIDAKGRCSAHYAARWGNVEALKWLLDKNPEPVIDEDKASPLDVACAFWRLDCALACVAAFGMPSDGMGGWGPIIRAVQVDPMFAHGDPNDMVRIVESLAPLCADDGGEVSKVAASVAAQAARLRGRESLAEWIEAMEAARTQRRSLGEAAPCATAPPRLGSPRV